MIANVSDGPMREHRGSWVTHPCDSQGSWARYLFWLSSHSRANAHSPGTQCLDARLFMEKCSCVIPYVHNGTDGN
jgi:hypothetical protein